MEFHSNFGFMKHCNLLFLCLMGAIQCIFLPIETIGVVDNEVSSLMIIKNTYDVKLEWKNDPCSPVAWKGIKCNEANEVISLNISNMNLKGPFSNAFGYIQQLKDLDLHSNSLTGKIQNLNNLSQLETLNLSFNKLGGEIPDLSGLSSLKKLDLQNNSFHGTVPESLGSLLYLHVLNLENNQLYGSLPISLIRSTLELRISGNPQLALPTPTSSPKPQGQKRKSSLKAIIGGIVGGAACVLLVFAALLVFYIRKHKSDDRISILRVDRKSSDTIRRYSFKEIKRATNNFKDTIGRGSFGFVYLGQLPDGQRVAVKVRFDPSQQAADSFINEVLLLSQVHHKNLVSLEGFCQDSKHQSLVYEYLPGGALTDYLYGCESKKKQMDWKTRLRIAFDAATGLEYLHNANPKVIHRDVKCSNILLDVDLNAKVCDFGLSKQIIQADATHVTTIVKGTAGYVDPEYYSTQQLTEKSDVYSFGVVLLELICGREPLCQTGSPDSYNLVLWAKPLLESGNYDDVVDKSLKNNCKMESLKKVACVAIECVERDAVHRPNMTEVLSELMEALVTELSGSE